MTVKSEQIEQNKVKLTITVDAVEFNKALDVAFKKVVKEVNVPGFRKGKYPRNMFERRFGVEALYEEALNYLIPIVYADALDEANIFPVAQPEIDIDHENMGKDKPLTVYATVVVKPEVKLGQYKGIVVKELSTEVTEEEIDNEIAKLADKQAELVIKEGEAAIGNTVVIDYEGFKDEVPFEGGKDTNHSLVLGSNSFIPGFEDELIGIKANETRTITVKFPDEYHSEELKGKEAKFVVLCHEVKERVLPEIDDEFVKELNRENVNTVAELKESIRKQLTEQKETARKNNLTDTVVDVASKNAEINVPEEMISSEAEKMMDDAAHRLEHQGLNLDLYLQYTGSTKEALLEQLKKDAEKRIRYNLTLEQIAKEENIQISDEEIEKEYDNIAAMYNVTIEQVKQSFSSVNITEDLKLQKAVDFLIENSVKE